MKNSIRAISHFFADNQALSLLLIIGITIFGLFAFIATPKQYNPEIIRPAFAVSVTLAGATPATAMDQVGYELIEELRTMPGVEDIMTTVHDGALISSLVLFRVGEDTATAKSDLLTALAGQASLATGAVKQVMIEEVNPETIPVLQVAVSMAEADVATVRAETLALRSALLAVEGVSEVTILGGLTAVVVAVDPEVLAAAHVPLATVEAALASVGGRLVGTDSESARYAVGTAFVSPLVTPADLELLPITPTLLLRDIATVTTGASPHQSSVLYSDKETKPTDVVMLGVAKRKGESAPAVTAAVRAVLEREWPQGQAVSYQVVSDDGVVAQQEIVGLTTNLLTSIVIVAVVLFLFLSPRASIVVLITVPLTFLAVLGIGYVAGETINRITLFALILSLGLLVDASIVVVDIIHEHLMRAAKQGRVVKKAVLAGEALEEVGVGLVLSAVTSVVVFLPMFYITGMMGPYMGPIAFFVPMALVVSLLVAIVLTPYIAVAIVRVDERDNVLSAYFRRQLQRLTEWYQRTLRQLIERPRRRLMLRRVVIGLFVVAMVLPFVGLVHFQMLPKADRNQLYLYLDAPAGTAREQTAAMAEAVSAVLLEHPDVTSTQLFVAGGPLVDFNGLFKGALWRTAADEATLRVNLTPAGDRPDSSTVITSALRASVVTSLPELASFVRFMEEPPGPPVQATVVAKVLGTGIAVEETAASLQVLWGEVAGVVDRHVSTERGTEQVVFSVDHAVAAAYPGAAAAAATWYEAATSMVVVGELVSDAPERQPVSITVPTAYRATPALLGSIPLVSEGNAAITFGHVAPLTYQTAIPPQLYEAATPLTYLTAEVEGRSVVYVMIEIITRLKRGELPGYEVVTWDLFGLTLQTPDGEVVSVVWGGEWEMTLENFRDLGIAMVAALLLVYGVLVAQYQSFRTPALILFTVPLGLIGIMFGFLVLDQVFGVYLTATALIGFIALIGIVVNNAIMYLEYVEEATAEGVALPDALVAAGVMRLRPILLTSLTTVLGSLTIAGDPVWSGLAWSIIFGLSLSTLLTLIVFPLLLLGREQAPAA